MNKHMITHIDHVPKQHTQHGERFEHQRQQLSSGGQQLGCSLYHVPPGKAAWPKHLHLANEEAIFIIHGQGTLYLGDPMETLEVRAGHYIALPINIAHQLINTHPQEHMTYLCISTMHHPDVTIYPDSNKIGIFAGSAPGGDRTQRTHQLYLNTQATQQYWDGE